MILSARMATLHALDTVYGVEDAYRLIEVIRIDAHNAQLTAPKG